jgi:DNA-binding phage protein
LEAGKANPTFKTLQEIADVLGLELVLQIKRLNSI